ncbi:MAG: FHA domain-containing protein [Armatimonadetes bacterium]|nr:FHA domain-containing protein [Armatimonadota bacterium]
MIDLERDPRDSLEAREVRLDGQHSRLFEAGARTPRMLSVKGCGCTPPRVEGAVALPRRPRRCGGRPGGDVDPHPRRTPRRREDFRESAPNTDAMIADGSLGRFFIIHPDKTKVDYPIPAAVTSIGSDAQNALCLTHPQVAPFHCRLEWRQGQAFIVDQASPGGTFVNQNRVAEQVLRQGDVVKVGDFFLVFHAPTPSGGGAPVFAVPGVQTGPMPQRPPSASAHPSTVLPAVVAGTVNQQSMGSGAGTIRIGRDPANTISLNHPQVSRYHAEIGWHGNAWYITDNRSTNGTFLNGQRLAAPTVLNRGDRIKIGDYSFFFDGQKLEHFSEEGNARIDAINLRREVGNKQIILQDVSLSIYPREFVAVVGVSGAGKSTLINALSGFRPADYGVVLFNGLDYYENIEALRSTLGYVPQDDIIHPELTTGRALHYAAKLRMAEDTTSEEMERRITEVLDDLQLEERRQVPVHRLSGGQRKRVSIGVELLTKPRLFYLDEPTSGLDPGMEAEMMRIFRKLADQGQTLILITHATRNIMLCDKVVFLARGGHLAFYGPPAEALQYFNATDFADIYIKVDQEKSPQQWDQEYKQSPYYQKYVAGRLHEVNDLVAQARSNPAASMPLFASSEKQVSLLRQFGIVAGRYLEILSRDRINMAILLAQAPLLSLALLVLVYNTPDVFKPFTMANLSDAAKLATKGKIICFLLTFFSLMCGTINSVREIVKEYPIYKRERTVNLGILPYVLSKFFVLAVVSAFQTAVFISIVFWKVNPPKAVDDFHLLAFLTLFMVNLAGVAMGLAVSTGVNNQNTAVTMLPIVLLVQIVLSGALLPLEGLKALSSLTIMKWGFEMMGKITELWKVLPAKSDFSLGVPANVQALVNSGQEYASQFDVNFWGYFAALSVFVVFFLAMACMFQRAKDFRRE